MRRVPSTRGVNPVPEKDSFRKSYSPLTLDRSRRRSPDGILGNSRGASPPRSEEEFRRRPLMRSYDDVRSAAYLNRDGYHVPRPMGSTSYMTNSTIPAGPAKPVGQMLAAAPPGVNEQHTVESLLRALSLEKYIINFKAEEVDMHALRQMGDNDLKDLGIPMLVLEEMKVKKVSLVAGQLRLHSDGKFLTQLIFKRSIVIELISVPKGQRDIFYELRIEYDPQKKKLVVHGWWAYLYDSNTDTYYSRCCIGWTGEEEQEAGRVLDELLEGNPNLQIQMDEIWYSQGNKTNKEFRTHEYLKHGRVEETEDFNEGYYNELMAAVKYSGYEKLT
ncbi:hypothetical protein OROMI_016842 [Orobanche minor]